MYCRACGEEMNDSQAICLKCGVKRGEGNGFCASCGKAVSPDAEFCLNCGVAVKKMSGLNGQDRTTMGLIALFTGGFGVHNFMLGETKKGIVKILTFWCCGIGAILAVIDAIKIFNGSYVVEPDKMI